MFDLIFFAIFFVFAASFFAVGLLKGRKYNWQFSTAKIITLILAIIISTLISSIAAYIVSGVLLAVVLPLLNNVEGLSELISKLPSATAAIRAIIATVIAPVLFFIFLPITKALLGLAKRPIARLLMKICKDTEANTDQPLEEPAKKDKNAEFRSAKKFDAIGATCGALCSLLLFIALAAPTVGFLSVANGAVNLAGDDLPAIVTEIADAATDNAGTKTVKVLGGSLIYDCLTTYPVSDEMVTVGDDFEYVSSLGNAIACYANEDKSNLEKAAAIRQTEKSFSKAKMLPTVAAEFLSGASDNWSQNKDFCGIEPLSIGEDFDPTLREVFASLKNSNSVSIREDYNTIANSLSLIVEHGAIEALGKDGDILHVFKDEELISGIMIEMLHNERLSPAVEAFTNAGISIIADSLGAYENADELYSSFISDMRKAYTDNSGNSYESFKALSDSIDKIYDKYGIGLSDGVAECIAISMLDTKDLYIYSDDSFRIFFGASDNASAISAKNPTTALIPLASSKAKTSANAVSLAEQVIFRLDNAATLERFEETLDNCLLGNSKFFVDLGKDDRAKLESSILDMYKAKEAGKEITCANAAFSNADDLGSKSVRLTKDKLHVSLANVTDIDSEAKALAGVLASAVDITDSISDHGGKKMVDVIKAFGPILDSFQSCQSIGKEGTANLVILILQSEMVRDSIGFRVTQANDVSSVINRNATDGESYTTLLNSVGQTINVIQITSDKANGTSSSETTEAVKELIKDMTPASAETLKQLTTADTIKNYGVPEENAESVSDTLSYMFGEMSAAKENGLSEEEYQKEAEAVNDMLNMAMNIGSSEGDTLFGEDSVTGISASEYVDRVLDSTVISNTVINAAYGDSNTITNDPLGMAKELTDSEKAELVSALDSNWKAQLASSNSAADNADRQKLLSSIAAMIGVEVEFSGNSVIAK